MKGRTAVVTGGSRGLGLAIARRLLENGARVAVWDVDAEALDAAGEALSPLGEVLAVTADVASPSSVAAALASTEAALGPASILVNNAAIPGPNALSWEVSLDEWQRVLDVNLTGTLLCCRAVIPAMLRQEYGRIVNIASVAAKEPSPMIAGYAASKAAVVSLTKTLGRELATSGITVNCVAPGAIRTAIFDRWPEAYVDELLQKIPMKRFGTPQELAALVAWVASAEASFSTGAVFDMSGGRADY